MKTIIIFSTFCCYAAYAAIAAAPTIKETMDNEWNKLKNLLPTPIDPLKLNSVEQTWCTCGVFLSGQFTKNEPPKGNAALMHEQDSMYPCTPVGAKQCSNKCLETV